VDKGSNGRQGKVISGHSTRIDGLNRFLPALEKWPEVKSIRLGHIEHKNTVGRKSKRLKPNSSSENGIRAVQSIKRPKGGGGFTFKATRPAFVGNRETGIRCFATYGRMTQIVILYGDDLEALKRRLKAEGYGANW